MGPHASDGDAARPEIATALDALRRIVRALRLSSRALEKELGVSGAQLFVLQKLADGPAPSIGALAARTVTDQSSVSVVVSRLVDKRLVSRSPSKTDARRAEIALTPKGRALLRRAPPPAQTRLVEALSRLDARDAAGLAHGLGRLVAEMGAEAEHVAMFFEEDLSPSPGERGDDAG
ncbi:MAG TPA: MarR family winged helix-turn-helix transcriptional regulator [Minicystis sp.]|nr:MarR family winged helix-turn-helix transcriptional regulator [Minicystis sp.]